jgi:hypothetical protein
MKTKFLLSILTASVASTPLTAQVMSNSSTSAMIMPAFIGKSNPVALPTPRAIGGRTPIKPITPIPLPSPTPIVKPTPVPTPPPFGSSAQIKLNHQRQESNLCVPTSASIALNKFGQNYTPRHIKVLTTGRMYDPNKPFNDFTTTTYSSLVDGLRRVGIRWNVQVFANDANGFRQGMDKIKNSIKYGYPVLVSLALGVNYGHCVVVSGFNDFTRTITYVDPALPAPGIRQASYDDFEKLAWNSFISHGMNSRTAVFMY